MPSATDVVREALLQPIPCPNCQRTEPCRCYIEGGAQQRHEARADLIVAALTEFGFLTKASALPSEDDLREAAQYLAARSRNARYTQVADGWQRLLEAAADVNIAYHQASKHVGSAEQEPLAKAKTMLLDALARRGSEVRGA